MSCMLLHKQNRLLWKMIRVTAVSEEEDFVGKEKILQNNGKRSFSEKTDTTSTSNEIKSSRESVF